MRARFIACIQSLTMGKKKKAKQEPKRFPVLKAFLMVVLVLLFWSTTASNVIEVWDECPEAEPGDPMAPMCDPSSHCTVDPLYPMTIFPHQYSTFLSSCSDIAALEAVWYVPLWIAAAWMLVNGPGRIWCLMDKKR